MPTLINHILLCIALIFGQLAATNVVLCVGADGHVEVESSLGDRCNDLAGSDHSSEEECCDSCDDIILSGDIASGWQNVVVAPEQVFVIDALVSSLFSKESLRWSSWLRHTPQIEEPAKAIFTNLERLKKIVLLI